MKLRQLPIIGSLLHTLDKEIQEVGLQKAVLNIVHRSGTKLIVKGKTAAIEKILKSKPVIIVATHPYESDSVPLLASLPSRRDCFLIVNAHFLGVSSQLDSHFIPVYIWHHKIDRKHKKPIGRIFYKLHPTPIYEPEEEHKRNMKSMSIALDKLQKGGLVIIFPGKRLEDKRWYSGVGHLIKGLGKNNDAYIVKAYIKGTSDIDYLRMIPKAGMFFSPMTVTFAEPKKAADFFDNDGKKITAKLEKEYHLWTQSLTKKL